MMMAVPVVVIRAGIIRILPYFDKLSYRDHKTENRDRQ